MGSAPRPPRPFWAWPLRIGAQLVPAIWIWKFWGCMQMDVDCAEPTRQNQMIAQAILFVLVAASVEFILIINRALDKEKAATES